MLVNRANVGGVMGVRRFLLALIALCLGMAARPAAASCTFAQLAVVPVTLTGGRLLIPAKINGFETRLMIDSGAFFSAISPAGSAHYKMSEHMGPDNLIVEGAGGHGGFVSVANARDFEVFGAPFHNVDFILLQKGFGAGVEGLLGQNFLGALDVEYDLPDGFIRLFKATGCRDRSLAYWAGASLPYSQIDLEETGRNGHPMQTVGDVHINGAKVRVTFDTGAPVSTISLGAAARAGVKPTDTGVAVAGFSSGINRGSYFSTWLAPFADIKIGDEEVKNSRLFIGNLGIDTDMLVGVDFFRSHRVLVSNSQHKMYFTYSGGPVFNMKTPPPATPAAAAATDPGAKLDANGYSRRAADFSARGDYADAVADLTSAIALGPNEPGYYLERGLAEERLSADPTKPPAHRPLDDFNQALTLKPDSIPALLARAGLYRRLREPALAKADLDAADKAAASQPAMRLMIANVYAAGDDYPEALSEFDQWIAANPKDDRMAQALNGRCWARAMLGQDLDKALKDCNAALKLAPGDPTFLDSRGLVKLRLGDADGSIRDYNDAIRLNPGSAWSHYGRGIAKLRKGLNADGEADLQAAKALRPSIAEQAAKHGIAP
jgi:tetratricopeptide (TPR) repeat protein